MEFQPDEYMMRLGYEMQNTPLVPESQTVPESAISEPVGLQSGLDSLSHPITHIAPSNRWTTFSNTTNNSHSSPVGQTSELASEKLRESILTVNQSVINLRKFIVEQIVPALNHLKVRSLESSSKITSLESSLGKRIFEIEESAKRLKH